MARLALLALLLAGCAPKVQIVSVPAGAFVTEGKRRLGSAPVEVQGAWLVARRVTVRLAGYRPMELRLTPAMARSGLVEVRLVPEHGGAGTWAPEDVP